MATQAGQGLITLLCVLIGLGSTLGQGSKRCQGDKYINGNIVSTSFITSDNFPDGYLDYTWCRYYIRAPIGHRVKLTFAAMDIESSANCVADSVKFFDLARSDKRDFVAVYGACRNPSVLISESNYGPVCGQLQDLQQPSYQSRGEEMVVEFCTDYSMTRPGWNISLQYIRVSSIPPLPNCDETIQLTSLSQVATIHSPNYPNNYQDFERCVYTIINSDRNRPIKIIPRDFQLSEGPLDSGGSCYDDLTIFDITNGKSYGPFCGGRRFSNVWIENSERVEVRFTSDAIDTFKGFAINIQLQVCRLGQISCDDQKQCIDAASHCDGVTQCADGSDEDWQYCAPECGKSHHDLLIEPGKIVGGVEANEFSIPWQVAFIRTNGRLFCGGSIITDRWLVSAAHCFQNPDATNLQYRARLGASTLSPDRNNDSSIIMVFEKVICHPYYAQSSSDFDYCLIKLKEKIPFRKNIAPICLPPPGSDVPAGTNCMVSGWGADQSDNPATWELRHVVVPVVNRSRCYSAYFPVVRITDNMICAQEAGGGKDSCQGDSGGPFVCRDTINSDRYVLSGIVSFGIGCALPKYPGVYARTGQAIDWITDTMARN